MNKGMNGNLRSWVLGIAAPGLLWHSVPVSAQIVPTRMQKVQPSRAPITQLPQQYGANQSVGVPNQIQQISQTGNPGEKSEVQKQLEAMYEKDGREMPDMKFNLQPIKPHATNNSGAPNNAGMGGQPQPQQYNPQAGVQNGAAMPQQNQRPGKQNQGHTQYQPRAQASPYTTTNAPRNPSGVDVPMANQSPATAAARPNRVSIFFKKLTTANKPLSSQPPVPPDYANGPPVAPSAGAIFQGSGAVTQTQMSYTSNVPQLNSAVPNAVPATPISGNQASVPAVPQLNPAIQANANPVVASTPVPSSSLPALSDQPMALPITDSTPASTAVAVTKPVLQDAPLAVEVKQPELQEQVRDNSIGDFPNPFPDQPEVATGAQVPAPPVEPPAKPATIEIPKTGPARTKLPVRVRHPEPVAEEPAAEITAPAAPAAPAATEDDPFDVSAKDFVEPNVKQEEQEPESIPELDPSAPSLGDAPGLITPLPLDGKASDEPKPLEAPGALDHGDLKEPTPHSEAELAKMQKIRDRFGMKGLKGFCPVSLRDERELIDARPDFHFVYRRQKFHFASAEARKKFEANPARYVPAAYGADVVALYRDREIVEGTLEFAAWYRGRLYLFGTEKNYQAFIAGPSQYVTLEEIE